MIFKTLNGDLTVFNKKLISTKDHLKTLETVNATVFNRNGTFNLQGLLVNSPQSVSTLTKLNNAFKAYNGNLSKSTQLQNAYVQAVGKQNISLGKYLAGLNGAKASIGGYIKYLVAAKAASIGLQVAYVGLKTAISMGITLTLNALVSQISKWIHAQEEARKKAIELTNSYKEQKNSLNSQIEKYKELKENLDRGNLSIDDTRSIKEQLLEIQKSLIESYGDEVSNIDLVNGKYREQLGLLDELSKEKATDYVIENRDVFADAKEALKKIKTYNIGTVTSWNDYAPETDDQKKLIEYLDAYSDLLDLTYPHVIGGGVTVTFANLSVKADVENADDLMHQLYEDLDKFGKENGIDVSGILYNISKQIRKTQTDELKEYKTIYDEYMKAEVVRNDTLRPLYQQSIQAVEDYNKALSSGEGVAEAKANLNAVQQAVQNATDELEGSQEVFDGIYDRINENAESAYNLGQAFENDESVQGYAEQLKGLTDIDLKAINFEDNVQSPGEEAFGALIDILGLSEDEVQKLIDKLIELGYVQGEVQSSKLNNDPPTSLFAQLTNSTDSLDKFQSSVKSATDAYATLLSGNYTSFELLDSIQAINQAVGDMGKSLNWEVIDGLPNSLEQLGNSIEYAAQKYAESVLSDAGIDVDSKFGQMLANNIVQAQKASTQLEVLNDQIDSLQSSYSNLTDILETYNETGYITFDQLQTLLEMEPQYLSCLIDENGQLQLNEVALTELANKRLDDAEAQAIQQAITELGQIALQDEKQAVQENAEAFTNAIDDLANYNTELANTMAEATVGASAIRDLNAAINDAEARGATDDQINAVLNNLETKLQLIKNVRDKVTSDGLGSVINSGSNSSRLQDTHKQNYEKELQELEHAHDMGLHSDEEYWETRIDLNEKYFGESSGMHQKYLDEYRDAEEAILGGIKNLWKDYYDQRKSELKDLISYAQELYDKEIDSLDASIEKLEERRDTEKMYWQNQIDDLGDEIDALQDANDEKQRAIDLQNKQYQLQKAMHQRTMLIYSESQGLHYVTDDKAVRDAKNDLDDAENDNKIEGLKKQQKDLQKQLDTILETYDSQIESIEKQIDSLNKVKSAWSEIVNNQELKELEERLKSIFGDDVKEKILSDNTDFINGIISQYSDTSEILKTIEDATLTDIQNMVSQYGVLPENLIYALNEGIPNVTSDMHEIVDTAMTAASEVSSVADAINNIPESKDVTISIHTVGVDNFDTIALKTSQVISLVNTYASGTKRAQKGIAVVGEEKPEVVITNNKKVLLAEHPTLLNMEGGETVFDGDETEKMLKARGLRRITPDELPLLKALTQYNSSEITQRFTPNITSPANAILSSTMQNASHAVTNNSSIQPSYTMGDVHIHCPGITKDEVVKQIGTELTNVFSGMSLKAYQRANITR